MINDHPLTISTSRLVLLLLNPELLALSLERDRRALEDGLLIAVPDEWFAKQKLIRFRLQQLGNDPDYQPWSIRAISLRADMQMIGYINCHTKPADPYLQPFAPQGVEYGYEIFPRFRRQGYALEACQGLMHWANENYHISQFVVSISPENTPSLRLAKRLGFRQVGSHIDEVDGIEYVFRLDYSPTRPY